MAGIFKFKDSSNNKKDFDPNEREKRGFFEFFDIYFNHFWDFIKLNLLFVLFCLPIVTIGPAIAGLIYCTNLFAMRKGVLIWGDFFDAFKKNFKQGLIISIINAVLAFVFYVGYNFYYEKMSDGIMNIILFAFATLAILIYICIQYYLHIIMVKVHLSLKGLFKNALYMTIIGIKSTFFTSITLAVVIYILYILNVFWPITYPIFAFSFIGLIISFNCYQHVEKYIINPSLEQQNKQIEN